MLDVAATASVSVATVSAVVNGTAPVSPELRGRIEDAIAAIGYKRNAIARSLKTGATKTIGLVIADITNPFFTDVVAVIQDVLHRAGYAMMLCCTDEDPEQQEEQISLLLDRMVDGLIIAPAGDDHALERVLKRAGIPTVLIDRINHGIAADAVVLDNQRAVLDAIDYLVGLGHLRIGYISGSHDTSTGLGRLAGYRGALENAGIPYDDALVRIGNFREKDAYHAAMQLLVMPDRPSAIFSANNLMVIGVMKAIRDMGLRCPDDISVSSFDDFPWADVFQPSLTTIAQPVQAIGEHAAQLILERLATRMDRPPRQIVLSGRLMIRSSCRPFYGADRSTVA
ncbi:LacI family DNA-binding transcriptional regulator [Rhizobium cauense]|uniref:LacI family DNA-binding transcriptional regulator n=1 Tax=Rhizobium cauense TaxID=1166683 RepID=UPI001C6E3401|nr:LacI family DNA-binding transcriptional regulator [Rhizobium cauense]MBW9118029.1 LacI family DNA-binding transcriptional regulator [Rhizobium cauense]